MSTRFECKICQKKYSSKQSLSNHKRIKHSKEKEQVPVNILPSNKAIPHESIPQESIPKEPTISLKDAGPYECKYCNKKYKYRQGKYRHQATCDNQHAIAIRLLDEKKKLYNQSKVHFNQKMQEYEKINNNKNMKESIQDVKIKIIEEYYNELNKINNMYDKQADIFALARLYNVYEIDKLNNIYKPLEEDNINTADNVNKLLAKSETKNNINATDTTANSQKKYVKNNIPKLLKNQSWDIYIGKEKGVGNCYCCNAEIDSKHFECGHIIPASKGGSETIENLRPICSLCNKSIGTKHMDEFIEKYIKKPIENL